MPHNCQLLNCVQSNASLCLDLVRCCCCCPDDIFPLCNTSRAHQITRKHHHRKLKQLRRKQMCFIVLLVWIPTLIRLCQSPGALCTSTVRGRVSKSLFKKNTPRNLTVSECGATLTKCGRDPSLILCTGITATCELVWPPVQHQARSPDAPLPGVGSWDCSTSLSVRETTSGRR